MRATIWHNPKCGTSRKTLAILEETPGVELEIIEYLKTPPSRDKLAALYNAAGITPREGLRAKQEEAAPLLDADG
ncbi:MAG TPA: arsenate reductase (glutaredoxin), partial [Rhizorhapis sp.]|nr:arsenate reductase (glutaredoxin) [Rhizorhapis sp.]